MHFLFALLEGISTVIAVIIAAVCAVLLVASFIVNGIPAFKEWKERKRLEKVVEKAFDSLSEEQHARLIAHQYSAKHNLDKASEERLFETIKKMSTPN